MPLRVELPDKSLIMRTLADAKKSSSAIDTDMPGKKTKPGPKASRGAVHDLTCSPTVTRVEAQDKPDDESSELTMSPETFQIPETVETGEAAQPRDASPEAAERGSVILELDSLLAAESSVRITVQKRMRDDGASGARVGETKRSKILDAPGSDELAALAKKLKEKEAELKEANDRVEALQSEAKRLDKGWHDKLNDLDKQLHDMMDQNKSLQKQQKSFQVQRSNSKKRIEYLEDENYDLAEQIQTINEQLNAETELSADWKKKYLEALEEMRPDYGDPDKVTDDTITSKWTQTVVAVHNVAELCLGGLARCNTTDGEPLHALVQEYKKLPMFRCALLQRFVWRRLGSDVFLAKNGIWGGLFGTFFTNFVRKMRDHEDVDAMMLSLVSRMKFRTAKDIDMDIGLSSERLQQLRTTLFTDLSQLLQPRDHDKLRDAVNKIFGLASELLVIFARSRAIFAIDGAILDQQDDPRPFNPEKMERQQCDDWNVTQKDQHVGVVMTPSVRKIGTADGGDFHLSFVICKAGAAMVHKPEPSS